MIYSPIDAFGVFVLFVCVYTCELADILALPKAASFALLAALGIAFVAILGDILRGNKK